MLWIKLPIAYELRKSGKKDLSAAQAKAVLAKRRLGPARPRDQAARRLRAPLATAAPRSSPPATPSTCASRARAA